jgi:aldehyde dehydrogenase (NAD+)
MTVSKNFIAGEWIEGVDAIANINPSDLSETIGHYAQASTEDLNRAVEAAQSAQREWAKVGIEQRYNILMSIGTEMMDRALELGELLSREEGKPLAEGKGEVYRAGQFFT